MEGSDILGRPLVNKGTAFTAQERRALGLCGQFPWRITTIEEQVALELEHIRRKGDDLEKYIGLAALQDRNETLFYRLLVEHLEELVPIVYTPTVGEACRRFSHILRRPRGLWITPDDIGRIPEICLRNAGRGVRLIVATDNERILGLGDQGAGGMGIPVGKLALYTAGAGIHPGLTLPISLDCGTDNADLLADPLYLGYPKPRLRGAEYDAFVEAFVAAVTSTCPRALLQWEDFKQHNAIRAARPLPPAPRPASTTTSRARPPWSLAGILAALQARGEPLAEQRLVLLGAGAAGTGIARLIGQVARAQDGGTGAEPLLVMLDSRGLVFEGRDHLDDGQAPVRAAGGRAGPARLRPGRAATTWRRWSARSRRPSWSGRAATRGAFTEAAIRAMAEQTPVPIIFPLSNPTAKSEATPADVLAWTRGTRAGGDRQPVRPGHGGGAHPLIGQANNVFVFPGVGLGAIVAGAREVTDGMFLVAATTLAGMVPAERLAQGALYPPLADLRPISRAIAIAVAREALTGGVAGIDPKIGIADAVDAQMWTPEYQELNHDD